MNQPIKDKLGQEIKIGSFVTFTKSKSPDIHFGKVTNIKAGTWPPNNPTIWIYVRATQDYTWVPNLNGLAMKDSKLSIPKRMVVINDPPQALVDQFAQAGF